MNFLSFIKTVHRHYEVQRLLQQGIRIPIHVVVFESDDWGSIRMPSLEARARLLKNNVFLQSPSSYDKYDTLASDRDLTALLETLDTVRDSQNNPAVITLDTVVANPLFEKIKESGYQEYYYEPFPETLRKYPHHEHAFELWKEGIEKKMFRPQYHGREHLNVQIWLHCLQQGDESALAAFDEGVFSMKCMVNGKLQRVLETYNAFSESDYAFMKTAIKEGMDLFEKLFGYRSESMIAPCYTWDSTIEEAAYIAGVKFIQGGVFQSHSNVYTQNHPHQTARKMGEKNQCGQIQIVRNCSFEPSQLPNHGKDRCLRDIERQFKLGHPAIVSCHRLNFIGDLYSENRDNNLKQFKELLKMIVKTWPDVVFMSSDQLGNYLSTMLELQ